MKITFWGQQTAFRTKSWGFWVRNGPLHAHPFGEVKRTGAGYLAIGNISKPDGFYQPRMPNGVYEYRGAGKTRTAAVKSMLRNLCDAVSTHAIEKEKLFVVEGRKQAMRVRAPNLDMAVQLARCNPWGLPDPRVRIRDESGDVVVRSVATD